MGFVAGYRAARMSVRRVKLEEGERERRDAILWHCATWSGAFVFAWLDMADTA